MTSNEAFYLLQCIQEETSRTEKINLLKEFLYDELFRNIVLYAYDPFKNYYIKVITQTPIGTGMFNDWTFALLDNLATRRLSGEESKRAVRKELERLDLESQKIFRQILKKDLGVGINTKSINTAWKGLIKVFPYMRCSTLDDVHLDSLNWKQGVFSQIKADGMFANISMTPYGAKVNTRLGNPFDMEVLSDFRSILERDLREGSQYHGELLVVDPNERYLERKKGNGILNSILKGGKLPEGYSIAVELWDFVPLDMIKEKGKYYSPYNTRYKQLEDMLSKSPIKLIETKIVHSIEEATEHFSEAVFKGEEGVIIKDPQAIWQDGTSRMQIKLKPTKEIDLRVVDFIEGTGKNSDTFGSILCTTEDGMLEVKVSGFTDEDRKKIWEEKEDWIGSIVSVKYNSLINSKNKNNSSLYLPRFIERRFDKEIADNMPRS